MELAKIRSLSDEELLHQEKTSGEQLFRLRFQVSMGQNDGVKKLRQLRKEIAQIKTVSRERELGVRGATHELVSTLPVGEEKKAAKKTAKSATAKTSAKKSAKKSASASAVKKGAGK
jgi:large subunit ribosomal protein L29